MFIVEFCFLKLNFKLSDQLALPTLYNMILDELDRKKSDIIKLIFFLKQLEEKDKQIEQLSPQLDTSQRINETLSISVQMEQAKTGQLQ